MQSTKKLSMYFKSLLFILSLAVFFQACSSKKITVYNQSASYWYNEMITSINQGDLDAADDTYTSLNSEHRNSPLIPTSLVILANAHVEEEEYELANYYLDEYLKRFAQSKNVDYVRYYKIKSKFFAFNDEFRNQKFIDTTYKCFVYMAYIPFTIYIFIQIAMSQDLIKVVIILMMILLLNLIKKTLIYLLMMMKI